MIKNLSDRLLAVLVPRTEASAWEFTKYCLCLNGWHYYKTCSWLDPAGTEYSCGGCWNSQVRCS
ncbi:hypothetical protein OHA25_07390 [Nonomuraea sp. NBC_00507]|uniref:hypothetical protein n=1 Tax=Nonomuraea sp. NBC_00507 TaxID=2976002 RepID=UPI002E17FD75